MTIKQPTFKNNAKNKEVLITKDSPSRSIAKAFSWRIIATATTFAISYWVLDSTNENQVEENIQNASLIASIEFFSKLIFYYFHERMWTNILWGKSWRSSYIGRRLWRRTYRKMHKAQ